MDVGGYNSPSKDFQSALGKINVRFVKALALEISEAHIFRGTPQSEGPRSTEVESLLLLTWMH